MKRLFNRKAYVYALCYLSLIPIFALIFSLVDLNVGDHSKGVVTYIYFSVVSITTLGYGDVLPNSSWAQIAAASESLLGIILIGLFLNALSIQHSQEIEQKELKKQEKENAWVAKERFISFERLLLMRIQRYQEYSIPLTVPISGDRSEINRNFKFNDMKDLFKTTLRLTDNNFKPAVSYYFDSLFEFTRTLEDLVKLGYASKWPEMENLCLDFCQLSKSLDFSESILNQPNTRYGNKNASEEDAKSLENHTGKVEFLNSNGMNQYVALYMLLNASFKFIDQYKEHASRIKNG
ncbi:MAG TPA: two pore domain potassium channel family protein [Pseudoalteromonas sp.]|uniref:Potassium channel domain-containing protein n=1 Tax=marine sediment metagenome TaxID=412755 RepID=A0A0F9MW00_9ZZZZ|nr:potassium channel family protein [Pseudoalteromonas sp.]HDZ31603.1 two pore domain potassium channel family protein [Pseudoalteromonas sp.]